MIISCGFQSSLAHCFLAFAHPALNDWNFLSPIQVNETDPNHPLGEHWASQTKKLTSALQGNGLQLPTN